jgi:glycosyltransferase involved in cell wall biosynthesis
VTKPGLFSLVLPCRNQADHIGDLLPRYLDALTATGTPFELVVVPNASIDATAEVVLNLAAGEPRVRVVENPEGGWGRSVRAGLDESRGDVLGYTNTARTDPAVLAAFLERYRDQGSCLVKARREARRAPLRSLGSTLYNIESRVCFGLRCSDFSSSFYRAARPDATGDLFDLELVVRAHRLGLSIEEIPLQGFRRHGGRSSTTLMSAWGMYAGALRLWLSGTA